MADFRRVNERLSVSPQITPDEVVEAKALGFVTIVNNRPDGEAPDQPASAEIEAAAKAAGLTYVHIPVRGMPTPEQVEETRRAIESSDGPVLAFCRTGTRCINTWSIGERQAGRDRDELIGIGRAAGYDLSQVLP
ncbi:MAG TPA: TIGR01244 family sulfur transferase [Caulobacteraceae bacterium]|nr:TIGR01244 family sulfur transferase [Caulobacteraceae bacterium]